jgi:hypothetical protein
MNNDNDARLEELSEKLDMVIRLLALSLISEADSLTENAIRLQRAGMGPKDIAALCNTTPNTISVALSTAKRERQKRRRTDRSPR